MKETIDESLFVSRFEDYKRVVTDDNPNGNFSYRGLRALFEFLEEYEEDTGETIELDVISLCCDYVEYDNVADFVRDYGITTEAKEGTDEYKAEIEQEIRDNTTLIKLGDDLDDGFIIQCY